MRQNYSSQEVNNQQDNSSNNNTHCLIELAMKKEIEDGIPEERRTRTWLIHCPCKKCSPFTF